MKASQVPGHFDIIIRKYFIKVTFAGTVRFIILWGPIGTCCSSVLHVYTYIMLMEQISMFVVKIVKELEYTELEISIELDQRVRKIYYIPMS